MDTYWIESFNTKDTILTLSIVDSAMLFHYASVYLTVLTIVKKY